MPLITLPAPETEHRPAKVSEALDSLGRKIVTGGYPAGAILPVEAALMAELSVSRTTLREVVRSLIALGLLEARPRIGTRVRPRQDWMVLSRDVLRWMTPEGGVNWDMTVAIDEAREIFEPAAAALAASRASRSQVTAIRLAYDRMERAAADTDIIGAIRADRDYHLAVLSATGNPVLQSFASALDAILGLLFKLSIDTHLDTFRRNLSHHRKVLEAIERRDPAAAQEEMLAMIAMTRRHLKRSRQALERG